MDAFGWFSIAVGISIFIILLYENHQPFNADEWFRKAKEEGWGTGSL